MFIVRSVLSVAAFLLAAAPAHAAPTAVTTLDTTATGLSGGARYDLRADGSVFWVKTTAAGNYIVDRQPSGLVRVVSPPTGQFISALNGSGTSVAYATYDASGVYGGGVYRSNSGASAVTLLTAPASVGTVTTPQFFNVTAVAYGVNGYAPISQTVSGLDATGADAFDSRGILARVTGSTVALTDFGADSVLYINSGARFLSARPDIAIRYGTNPAALSTLAVGDALPFRPTLRITGIGIGWIGKINNFYAGLTVKDSATALVTNGLFQFTPTATTQIVAVGDTVIIGGAAYTVSAFDGRVRLGKGNQLFCSLRIVPKGSATPEAGLLVAVLNQKITPIAADVTLAPVPGLPSLGIARVTANATGRIMFQSRTIDAGGITTSSSTAGPKARGCGSS